MSLRPGRIAGMLAVALLFAACDALAPPSPRPRDTAEPFVPPAAPTRAEVVACVDINGPECRSVAAAILATLPGVDGEPFWVMVRLDPCPDPEVACPESLVARRGTAHVEYPDGGAALAFLVAGPPAAPVSKPDDDARWTDPIQPGSPQVEDEGPWPFEVGHCGLLHAVDFDGSFWVLVGDVHGEDEALQGGETGSIALAGEDRARYLGAQEVVFELARFPGAKRFEPCR